MQALNTFENYVFNMRKHQQAYFKTKQKQHLVEAKKLEKKIDELLMRKIQKHYNPDLF